jgi:hypothetical protein
MTTLAICGTISRALNDNVTTDAGIYFIGNTGDQTPQLVAPFGVQIPGDPCRTMQLRGGLLVDNGLATDIATNPASYLVRFGGIAGRLRASPIIPPDPVSPPDGAFIPPDPIAPAATKCTIEVKAAS